ncbi:hypothetical protein FHT87_005218 [Rhizobium sp. BK316]|uniref:hypothetical protein n=1 Tax=Rhizobium sp. BK316 TaxID=2587053 RepID=UPI00161FC93E|nr:hypothetical protein [Rhizobium sp. BK316]MBB3411265.1 hypothetical protein [Rhizobium sp. BK316]
MTISASTLRNIIAILRNIDRDQIDSVLSAGEWIKFRDDPYGSFLRMNDEQQDAIARIVSERLGPKPVDEDQEWLEALEEHETSWLSPAELAECEARAAAASDFHGEPPALKSALTRKQELEEGERDFADGEMPGGFN